MHSANSYTDDENKNNMHVFLAARARVTGHRGSHARLSHQYIHLTTAGTAIILSSYSHISIFLFCWFDFLREIIIIIIICIFICLYLTVIRRFLYFNINFKVFINFLCLQIFITFSAVFGVAVYRICMLSVWSMNPDPEAKASVRMTVTTTGIILNMLVVLVLEEVYGAIAVWLTELGTFLMLLESLIIEIV